MLKTIAFILLRLVATLLAITFLTFLMVALLPGDPVDTIIGTGPRTEAQVAAIREELNLDDPFLVRYFSWLGAAVTGDLGDSYITDQPVSETISQRVTVTAQLAFMAIALAVLVAIPVGVLGAYKQSKWQDSTTSAAAQVALSIPNFIVGIFLIWLFAVKWDLLPASNWNRLSDGIGANLQTSIMPATALALGAMAVFSRLIRSDMIATLREDYILSARAKGLSDRYILFRHALRPSSLSLMTIVGISFGALLGGTVIIEQLFAIPGLGGSLINAINGRDIILIQGITVFIAVMFIIINTVVDLLYAVLDPADPQELIMSTSDNAIDNAIDNEIVKQYGGADPESGSGFEVPPGVKQPRKSAFGVFKEMPILVKFGVMWLFLVFAGAIYAQLDVRVFNGSLPLADPNLQLNNFNPATGEFGTAEKLESPSWAHLLGTDTLARDTFSRALHGAWVSVTVAVVSVMFGVILGGVLGSLVGFVRGKTETAFMAMIDVLLAFPALVLLLALVSIFEVRSLFVISFVIGVLSIPAYMRVSRANSLAISNREFIMAAQAIGTKKRTILWREIIPNVMPTLIAYAMVAAAGVIVVEGALSFLGLSVQLPTSTWGNMIAQARGDIKVSFGQVLYPALILTFTVLALNQVGDFFQRRSAHRASSL